VKAREGVGGRAETPEAAYYSGKKEGEEEKKKLIVASPG